MTDSLPLIGVIGGTGALGSGLAGKFAAAGYPIIIGSREAGKAATVAEGLAKIATGTTPKGATNADAAAEAEVVVLAVPWSNHAAIIADIKPHVTGKLVVDTTVPLVPPKVARVQLPPDGSAAATAQRSLGEDVRVVSAFHAVAAHKLQGDHVIDCDVLVFGDKRADRDLVIALVKAAGMRGLHAGPLVNSAAGEALTSILIGINRTYEVDGAGIRITGISAS